MKGNITSSARHNLSAPRMHSGNLPSSTFAKASADLRRGEKPKKVLIALSGGIDSAVSAYLLQKQGYEVEAAFMKNWSATAGLKVQDCPWLVDRQDALRVAAFLRIPMHTLDFEKQYAKTVMNYFFAEYKKGRTPNPDVMCNKEIKFKLLYNWAMKNGFDYLATGHYARIRKSENLKIGRSVPIHRRPGAPINGHATLMRSADEFKDQTYFIYNIKKEQLPHLLFPIGGMKKSAVRSLARKIGLPNAEKRESMGLCFVGKIRLKDFLEQKLKPKPGRIVLIPFDNSSLRGVPSASERRRGNLSKNKIASAALAITGKRIGIHQGLFNYTIGQRQGINVGGGGPYYVVKKDLKSNTLFVTNNAEDKNLMTKEVQLHSVNWLVPDFQFSIFNFQLTGRYRHQGQIVPLTIRKLKNDLCHVVFKHPQKAVASGQSLVLYRGRECVGGGIIV